MTGTGNTINLSQVATAANLSLTAASRAQVVLPALTQIAENAYAYGSLQANGANSLLDLSHVTTLAVNDIFTSVQASSGGEVNLHNLLSITSSSGQTANLNASGGTIDASNLSPGPSNIQVQSGGNLLLGSLNLHNSTVALSGANSTLTVQGNLTTDPTSTLNLGYGTTLLLEGSFSNGAASETLMTATSATVEVIGPSSHTLEVAGQDLGAADPGNNGNFGFGCLVVGQSNSPATLTLVDLINNGNRSHGPEALYLFGSDGSDGLTLLDGSTLVLDDLDAYDSIGGSWVSLQALLGGRGSVAFSGGYLAQHAVPEPSTLVLLGAGAVGLLAYVGRRRRQARRRS